MTHRWLAALRGDPRPWLLDPARPAVRQLALRWLEDRPADDPDVLAAQAAASARPPVAPILDAQEPGGWWVKPGPGYSPKYTGTVWSLIVLEQLGADPADPRVDAACQYVLEHTQAASGGFGCSGAMRADRRPPPSSVLHCLNGNLLRALIAFGHLGDPRVAAAVDWQARAVLGGPDAPRFYASGTSAAAFACGVNEGMPCAWGAVKALRGLAAIPTAQRSPGVQAAIGAGVELLLSVDPATAHYPAGWGGGVIACLVQAGLPVRLRRGHPAGRRGDGGAGSSPRSAPARSPGPRPGQAGRSRPVAQRVPVPGQAVVGRGRAGPGQPVGHAPCLPVPAGRPRVTGPGSPLVRPASQARWCTRSRRSRERPAGRRTPRTAARRDRAPPASRRHGRASMPAGALSRCPPRPRRALQSPCVSSGTASGGGPASTSGSASGASSGGSAAIARIRSAIAITPIGSVSSSSATTTRRPTR